MKNIFYRKLVSLCLIVSLIAILSPIQIAEADGSLSKIQDKLDRLKTGETAKHTIQFKIAGALTGDVDGDDTIVIDLSSYGTFANGDISSNATFEVDPEDNGSFEAPRTLHTDIASGDTIVVSSKVATITLSNNGGNPTPIVAGAFIQIVIGSSSDLVTNPGASNSVATTITTKEAGSATIDSGVCANAIISDDQVAVTADVDETISFSISSPTAALGTMTTGTIASASAITLTMSTNASAGYVVTVQDEGDASNPGLYKSTVTTKLIASSQATLANGTEGYGIQAAAGTGAPTIDAAYLYTGNDVGALSRTAATMVSKSGAVDGNTATMTVKAAISATTPAGDYADTLTLICTGTF
jgi:hypothetical protein